MNILFCLKSFLKLKIFINHWSFMLMKIFSQFVFILLRLNLKCIPIFLLFLIRLYSLLIIYKVFIIKSINFHTSTALLYNIFNFIPRFYLICILIIRLLIWFILIIYILLIAFKKRCYIRIFYFIYFKILLLIITIWKISIQIIQCYCIILRRLPSFLYNITIKTFKWRFFLLRWHIHLIKYCLIQINFRGNINLLFYILNLFISLI